MTLHDKASTKIASKQLGLKYSSAKTILSSHKQKMRKKDKFSDIDTNEYTKEAMVTDRKMADNSY